MRAAGDAGTSPTRGNTSTCRWTIRWPSVLVFSVLAVALSSLLWSGVLIEWPLTAGRDARLDDGLLLAGGFGPALATVVLIWAGPEELDDWVRKRFQIERNRIWYAIALGGPVALHTLVVAGYAVAGGPLMLGRRSRPALWVLPLLIVHHTLIAGGNEEVGWRGFALPRLRSAVGLYPAALAVGLVWAVWHLPLFVLPSGFFSYQWFPLFVGKVLAIALILAVLYEATDGGVVPAMLFHGTWNAVAPFRPVVLRELSRGHVALHFQIELIAVWVGVLVAVGWHATRRCDLSPR